MRKAIIAAAVVVGVVLVALVLRGLLVRSMDERAMEPVIVTAPPQTVGAPPATERPGEGAAVIPPADAPLPGAAPLRPGAPDATSPVAPPSVVQPPAPGTAVTQGVEVLQRASAAYERVSTLRANFTVRTENPLLRQTTTSRGTLFQRRPDRLLLRFEDPAGDVIVSDGTHFWVYYPSIDAQQVTRLPAAAAGRGGVDLQAQFIGDPVARFEHTLHGTEEVAGRPAHLFTLVPRDPQAGYARMRVWIDASDFLARRFEIIETSGVVRRFDLGSLQTNLQVSDDLFRFTPPPGVRVVER
jgi:outer membrane lipoprotein carrier protein